LDRNMVYLIEHYGVVWSMSPTPLSGIRLRCFCCRVLSDRKQGELHIYHLCWTVMLLVISNLAVINWCKFCTLYIVLMSRVDSQLTPFERVECEILFRYWLCLIWYWLCFLMCRCAVLNQKASKDQGSFGASR